MVQAERVKNASRERRDRLKIELRRIILDAACDVFDANGYEGFSLRQVAERIGYSPTTIYLYFQDKDDLLRATVQQGFDDFDRSLEVVAAANPDPLPRIEALGRAYVDFGLQNPALYRLMFMQRSDFYFMPRFNGSSEDGALPGPERPRTVAMSLLMQAVEEAMAQGVVRPGPPLIMADVLWAGAHGLVSLAISPLMSPEHAQHVIDLLLATLIDGIKTH